MSAAGCALLSLLLPGVSSTLTVDSSLGDPLTLSCPSPGPPCGPVCSWRGPQPPPHPHHLTVSSGENRSDEAVTVSFNKSSCQCSLFIQNASLEHSGLWTCQLKQDGKIHFGTTLDIRNIPHNKSEAFLDQPYITENQEEWKLSQIFLQQESFICLPLMTRLPNSNISSQIKLLQIMVRLKIRYSENMYFAIQTYRPYRPW